MIKAYCDRCEKEIPRNSDSEYFIELEVKNTCWVGNRDKTYFAGDYNTENAYKNLFVCKDCLNKFSDMVKSFMELQQKGEE